MDFLIYFFGPESFVITLVDTHRFTPAEESDFYSLQSCPAVGKALRILSATPKA